MYIEKLHKIWLCQNDKGGMYMYPKRPTVTALSPVPPAPAKQ